MGRVTLTTVIPEQQCIATLMQSRNSRDKYLPRINRDYFEDPICRLVINIIYGLHTQDRQVTVERLSAILDSSKTYHALIDDYIDNGHFQDRISGLQYLDAIRGANVLEQEFIDCLDHIHKAGYLRAAKLWHEYTAAYCDQQSPITFDVSKFEAEQERERPRMPQAQQMRSVHEILRESSKEHAEYLDGTVVTAQTGIQSLDTRFKGFAPPELTVLAGRPGTGKTALALHIASQIAVNLPVLFISLEMSGSQISHRIIANRSQQSMRLFSHHEIDQAGYEQAVEQSLATPLKMYIPPSFRWTISQMESAVADFHSETGGGLVVLDYLQLILPDSRGQKKYETVSEVSRSLKSMALQWSCPILALSQLSREIEKRENKEPLVSDLRESGSIEQDADNILMLWRPEYAPETYVECSIKKQRQHKSGTAGMTFIGHTQTFESFEGAIPRKQGFDNEQFT